MLVGAVAPIPFWLWQRRFPDTRLRYINLPVMLNGPTLAPPANGINYVSWFIVGFIFRTYLFIYSCQAFVLFYSFSVLFCWVVLSLREILNSLVEVWRKSGGSLEECWTDSHASPALWAIFDGFDQASLAHKHKLRFVCTLIGVEPLGSPQPSQFIRRSTASWYPVPTYKRRLRYATGLVWRVAV